MAGEQTPSEIEASGDKGIVTRWLLEIATYEATFSDYYERGRLVKERYRDDHRNLDKAMNSGQEARFNILWSNTQTMLPVIFSRMPLPDVKRRFPDPEDKIGREAAIILERALKTSNEMDKSIQEFRRCREDFVLVSRAVARVIYEPTFSTKRVTFAADAEDIPEDVKVDDKGGLYSDEEELVFEECKILYWPWNKFGHTPTALWRDVDWIFYEWEFSKEQIIDLWGPELANEITYSERVTGVSGSVMDQANQSNFLQAKVFEIFDKTTRRRLWISPGLTTKPLGVEDDPYGLEGFFPTPEPAFYIGTTNTLVPVPTYIFYQDQANELDIITQRINSLIDQLRVRGIYDPTVPELETLMSQPDGKMIPVDNFMTIMEKGGLEGIINYAPITQISEALVHLYTNRETIKQTIYEITGISDIIRGQTDPRETRGAQSLKAQFAGVRMNDPASEFNRFIRDVIEIKGEMISEHFDAATLSLVVGKEVSEEVMQLLHDDKIRGFSIDIEVDTTVFEDNAEQQKSRIEFVNGLTSFMKEWLPALQAGQVTSDIFRAIMTFALKPFKVGREIEQALMDWLDGIEKQKQQQQQFQQQEQQKQAQLTEMFTKVEFEKLEADIQEIFATIDKKGAETEKIEAQIREILAKINQGDNKLLIDAAAVDVSSESQQRVQ
jgi:hypothetical protein